MAISRATTTSDLKKEAEPAADGYSVVIGPNGYESTVPDGILDALLGSGYKRK